MITCTINVTRIDKAHLFEGKSGKYLDITLIDKPDNYGNDGFVAQKVSKEAYQAGEKGPIIGNWKTLERRTTSAAPIQPPQPPQTEDDIPF